MFGISQRLIDNLRSNEIVSPTAIQQRVQQKYICSYLPLLSYCFFFKAIPEILEGNDVLLAAETGSGKTLTYILPLLQKLVSLKKKETTEEEKG